MKEIILSANYTTLTNTEIANQATSLIDKVLNNEVSAIQTLAAITSLEKLTAAVKKGIAEKVLDEHDKYGEKKISAYGASFERCEVGVKYDYSEDKEWRMLQENIEAIRVEQKARELILKETGRCGKSSTTSVKVTLAK